MTGSGLQPDKRTYNLLIKAHIVNRDTKSAMEVVDQMVCMLGYGELISHFDTGIYLDTYP
jgi:pentatricopeptide repeat protein